MAGGTVLTRRFAVLAAAVLMTTATACGSQDDGAQPSASATAPAAAATPPAHVSFPVKVSDNHRYLVDQDGQPWMMNGDSPQCMSANLSVADMEYFFANRAAHGFNTAWVNIICGPYTYGRADGSTFDNITPFTPSDDITAPNPTYWERIDTMVDLAKKYGITLVLDPADAGSFLDLLKNNGADKSRAYGEFLGTRYKDDVNIIWMHGNDYGAWEYDEYVSAVEKGIRATDPAKLQTIELNPRVSTSFDNPMWPPLIDLNAAYAYTPTYDIVRRAYGETPTMPVFMVEANYEYENNDLGPSTTDVTLRRQEYWTMTSGATGQLYGNKYTWGFQDDDWKQHFDTPAVEEYSIMAKFFAERKWWDLVPDLDNHFLTKWQGRPTDKGDVLNSDYATAAVTPDGTLAVVYLPTWRAVELDTSILKPGFVARWFDPTDGSYRPAKAPYETPRKNAAGGKDWVLVLEQPS
jgi:hypothetical protein